MNPLVSVIMAAFNAAPTIQDSIQSILAQSFDDFELIIIDDASTDNTAGIIGVFQDSRIRLVRNENNMNLAASLNKAIALSKGEFLARMDADDIMLPHRLETQVRFLQSNPEIGVVGSFARNITETGRFMDVNKKPLSHENIKTLSFFSCPMLHPSVMLRRNIVPESGVLYHPEFFRAQDMECWARLVHETRFANLPDILMLYRHQSKKAQKNMKGDLKNFRERIAERNLAYLIDAPSMEDKACWKAVLGLVKEKPKDVVLLAEKIRRQNRVRNIYESKSFEQELDKRVYRFLNKIWSDDNRALWRNYAKDSPSPLKKLSLIAEMKFSLKSIFHK